MNTRNLGLPVPRLNWSDQDMPHNLDHEDGYYSNQDGLAETRAVFMAGCELPDAWAQTRNFTIGELGFGTGLNFLCVWEEWQRTRPSDGWLHFISIEGAPLSRDDLHRAHHAFPLIKTLAQRLRNIWPKAVKGVHRILFDEDRISLTLYFMDVSEALPQMEIRADSWFLDGFAPARNEAMWSDTVLSDIARLSRPGTRAATFSVAGAVRRGLQNAGFVVAKMPGHGRKRHRLEAVYEGAAQKPTRRQSRPAAPGDTTLNDVLVIGGGIAGASATHAFLRRGINVMLVSKGGLGDAASGNPAALVTPRLDLDDTPMARFFRTAFFHAARTYARLGDNIWSPCGVLRLPAHDGDVKKFARLIAANALPASALSLAHQGTGLRLPDAGTVDTIKALTAMTKGAKQITGTVSRLVRDKGAWTATDKTGTIIARAKTVVLALGSGHLTQTQWLQFRYLKGQITLARLMSPYNGPALLADGYALALGDNQLLTGATYEALNDPDGPLAIAPKDHQTNMDVLGEFAPDLRKTIDTKPLGGRVSIRAATPDQMPYVGPLVDNDDFMRRFFALKDGFLDPKAGAAQIENNLFVLMGLGSRGFALAPLLGEALAAEALGQPSPLERGTAEALHPARVLERQIKP